jgi:hypothetical protein
MSDVQAFAPTQDTIEYGGRVLPTRRMTPGAVGALDGPEGNVGPEEAGALSLVYGSFADSDSAQRGFRSFTDAQRDLLDAPGFLRWFSFADGPHGYGLGLWRSAADAEAFTRGAFHRRIVTEQRQRPFEYSQFAGIFAAQGAGRRTVSCPACGAVTPAPTRGCHGCGRALDDGFA